MEFKLILSNEMQEKLESATSDATDAWNDNFHTKNYNEIIKISLEKLKKYYPKLNIVDFEFKSDCSLYGQKNFYFGYIINQKEKVIAYLFFIPITYKTRSGVLAQQVFPVMSGIMESIKNSSDNHISNRPIFIINLNEENFTPAMALNVLCGNVLDFHYCDLYERDIFEKLNKYQISKNIVSIEQLNKLIIEIGGSDDNEYFRLDTTHKVVTFLPKKLGDGVQVTNEPYWFVLKAYAAAYLANKQNYTIDMSEFDVLKKGNKTLDSFRQFINKITE